VTETVTDFTIEQVIDMRNNLMEYLLRHAIDPSVSGNPDSLTWSVLAMHYASEIESELRPTPHFRNAIVSTLEHYAYYMRFADVDRCIYANTPELYMISCRYALNIAVYQVDPDSSQHYTLIQLFPGDPNHPVNVVYLFLHGSHYQRIITADRG